MSMAAVALFLTPVLYYIARLFLTA